MAVVLSSISYCSCHCDEFILTGEIVDLNRLVKSSDDVPPSSVVHMFTSEGVVPMIPVYTCRNFPSIFVGIFGQYDRLQDYPRVRLVWTQLLRVKVRILPWSLLEQVTNCANVTHDAF